MAAAGSVNTQWFQKVWNERDDAAIDELFAADGIVHGLEDPATAVRGPAEFRGFRDMVLLAFPDLQFEILQMISTEDAEAVLFCVTATHQGEFMGVAPTGRRVEFHGMGMSRVADGKIQEAWNVIDFHTCLRQLNCAEG